MKVAVIVPTFNRPDYLREAIESVLRQTYPASRIELVIIDNGSQPPAAFPTSASSLLSFQLIRNEIGRNLASVRQQGVEASDADLVIHLDDDDLLEP